MINAMIRDYLTESDKKCFVLKLFAGQAEHGKISILTDGNRAIENGNLFVMCDCDEKLGGGSFGVIFYDYHCSIVNYKTGKSTLVYKEYALFVAEKIKEKDGIKGEENAKKYLFNFNSHWIAVKLEKEEKIKAKAESEIEQLNKHYEENCLVSDEEIESASAI